jgi:hypothetical protein
MKKMFGVVSTLLLSQMMYGQLYFTESADTLAIDEIKTEASIGNGISMVDFDGDGLDDVTIGTQPGKPIAFFRNTGDGFVRMPDLVDHQEEAKQVLWVDYDNDGDKDLHVSTFDGISRLYQNRGDLQLVDVTEAAGLPMEAFYYYGTCWADYNRDGWLDFYTIDHNFFIAQSRNHLFRNNGDGTFTDVTVSSGTLDPGKIPFCSAFMDVNNDKWPDIYTAADKLTFNSLLLNNGNGTFWDVSEASNADQRMNAMCVAVGDYDNNGWQDVYITNTPIGNALLRNPGPVGNIRYPVFEEVGDESGTGFYENSWGANFLDADNDGYLDLYVSGSVGGSDAVSAELYHNNGDGTFSVPEDAGMEGDTTRSFCNAIGDLDQNGFPDIVVINNPPYRHQVWMNEAPSGNNWVKIRLQGVLSNRDAVGTRIEAYSGGQYQQRFTHCGIGFMAQNSATEIMGVGSRTIVDSLVITWPTGHQDRFFDLETNQLYEIEEGMSTGGTIEVDPELNIITHARQPGALQTPIMLFPNPGGSELHIRFDHTTSLQVRVLDAFGRVHHRQSIEASPARLNLEALEQQLYFVEFTDEAGKKAVRTWMKGE